MVLNRDFKEFIASLNESEVKYLVIGGYAVNRHGYPRYTEDLDFWIWISPDNIRRLLKALDNFGFASLHLSEDHFKNPDDVVQLGLAPVRIDLLVHVDGLEFEPCYQRKVTETIDGVSVNLISAEDLIIAKRTSGRPQDLADAAALEKLIKKSNPS